MVQKGNFDFIQESSRPDTREYVPGSGMIEAAEKVLETLNRIPGPCNYGMYIPDYKSDPGMEHLLTEIADKSYLAAYGETRPTGGQSLFEEHGRGADQRSEVIYIYAKTPPFQSRWAKFIRLPPDLCNRIVAFGSVFRNMGKRENGDPLLLFEEFRTDQQYEGTVMQEQAYEYQHAFDRGIELGLFPIDIPRIVVSMLARDPDVRPYMNRLLSPQRQIPSVMFAEIASNYGRLILEERAQPLTQSALRPQIMQAYYPGYRVLYPSDIYDEAGQWIHRGRDLQDILPTLFLGFIPASDHPYLRVLWKSISHPIMRALQNV